MSTPEAPDKVTSAESTSPTPSENAAAALEEALKNARLLRVSSCLFLKEAKELLDSGKVNITLSNNLVAFNIFIVFVAVSKAKVTYR